MCGLWRILPDFCQEPLVGRFFSENPRVFQLLLKRIGFYFFKFSFLAWFDFFTLVFFFFFLVIHGKILHFEGGQISRVGRKAFCLWSLPPCWSKPSKYSSCLSIWSVGNHPAQECGRVCDAWILINHSYHCPMSWGSQGVTPHRHCLCAISLCLVQGTRHTAGSKSCVQAELCSSFSFLPLCSEYEPGGGRHFVSYYCIPNPS